MQNNTAGWLKKTILLLRSSNCELTPSLPHACPGRGRGRACSLHGRFPHRQLDCIGRRLVVAVFILEVFDVGPSHPCVFSRLQPLLLPLHVKRSNVPSVENYRTPEIQILYSLFIHWWNHIYFLNTNYYINTHCMSPNAIQL